MNRLSFILFLALTLAVMSTTSAFPIPGLKARAGASPPAPSSVMGKLKAKAQNVVSKLIPGSTPKSKTPKSKTPKFHSLAHHTLGYGYTTYFSGTEEEEVPLSKISQMRIQGEGQHRQDTFLQPDIHVIEGLSLCMIFTGPTGFDKFKKLPLIYENDPGQPPPYTSAGAGSQLTQLIPFFEAVISIRAENKVIELKSNVMRIPESNVAKAKELDLRTHCLKPGMGPSTSQIWGVAEWEKYKIRNWPAKMKADFIPPTPAIKLSLSVTGTPSGAPSQPPASGSPSQSDTAGPAQQLSVSRPHARPSQSQATPQHGSAGSQSHGTGAS